MAKIHIPMISAQEINTLIEQTELRNTFLFHGIYLLDHPLQLKNDGFYIGKEAIFKAKEGFTGPMIEVIASIEPRKTIIQHIISFFKKVFHKQEFRGAIQNFHIIAPSQGIIMQEGCTGFLISGNYIVGSH